MGKCGGSLSEDGEELKLTIPAAGGMGLTLPLDTGQVDDLIALLVRLRPDMTPPVPETFPDTKTFAGVLDPCGFKGSDRWGDYILLHLRHPGVGWLHFGIPMAKARAMGRVLGEKAETALATRAKARRN